MDLQLINVQKTYAGHTVLEGIHLDIPELKALALVGPSGGGKSTLLRVLAGLESVNAGQVKINGELQPRTEMGLREYRKKIGVVFQAFNLFPHLTAMDNILLPLTKVHGHEPEAARDTAADILKRFKLDQHAHKRPGELSGGQNQRIAIARAVAIQAECLMFDEPTSALDPEMAGEVLDVIRDLRNEGRKIILVTHQLGFARKVADSVAMLVDGKIVEHQAANAFFSRPQNPVSVRFLEKAMKYG